nr:MAG TPA: hypothetical protein [Caudoviricetes sp.]
MHNYYLTNWAARRWSRRAEFRNYTIPQHFCQEKSDEKLHKNFPIILCNIPS